MHAHPQLSTVRSAILLAFPFPAMTGFSVRGQLSLRDGEATLVLRPEEVPNHSSTEPLLRPTGKLIITAVKRGEYAIHASRVPLTPLAAGSMISNVARTLRIAGWTEQAQELLLEALKKPKRGAENHLLSIQAKETLALQNGTVSADSANVNANPDADTEIQNNTKKEDSDSSSDSSSSGSDTAPAKASGGATAEAVMEQLHFLKHKNGLLVADLQDMETEIEELSDRNLILEADIQEKEAEVEGLQFELTQAHKRLRIYEQLLEQ